MSFIKRVLSTVTGIFVFFIICFAFLFLIGLLFGSSSKDEVKVKNNSVLKLKLDFPIKDYAGRFNYKEYAFLNDPSYDGLFNIINAINYAATDDKIKGISIETSFLSAGISQTKAIRDALLNFKASEKFITSYADIYSQKDYYLSSVADTIAINPVGYLEYKGLYTERLYFKDFEDKYGLKMEVVRTGKYKSAVEPYLYNEMSDENREQTRVFLSAIWDQIKTEISLSRNLSTEQLNIMADSLAARTPERAVVSGLADKVMYHDEYLHSLKHALDIELKDKLNTVDIVDYAKHATLKLKKNNSENKIAVIYAEGEIIYGQGDEDFVGQGNINKSLKKARENDKVKAIVLRVNSPGGSALASELIWREIELTKKVKPVIVSMGNLAASGGYYIACNANKIIAEPTTITGSIGVFGTLPNGKDFADNIGINAEQVKTNTNAIMYSFFEPLNDNQRRYIKEGITNVYELFSSRVATGRDMSLEDVEEIAQGRVWIGTDALKNGLVDELGGLDIALERAAEASEISDYRIIEYPIFEKDFTKMLKNLGLAKSKEEILIDEIGEEQYKMFKQLKRMSQRKGVQLLLPYSTEIR